jgi:hypothetical protein
MSNEMKIILILERFIQIVEINIKSIYYDKQGSGQGVGTKSSPGSILPVWFSEDNNGRYC